MFCVAKLPSRISHRPRVRRAASCRIWAADPVQSDVVSSAIIKKNTNSEKQTHRNGSQSHEFQKQPHRNDLKNTNSKTAHRNGRKMPQKYETLSLSLTHQLLLQALVNAAGQLAVEAHHRYLLSARLAQRIGRVGPPRLALLARVHIAHQRRQQPRRHVADAVRRRCTQWRRILKRKTQ